MAGVSVARVVALLALAALASATLNRLSPIRLRRNFIEQASNDPNAGPWIVHPSGFRYKRFSVKLNWWDARDVCALNGGDLASFADAAELNFIFNEVSKTGASITSNGDWIGLNDLLKEGDFQFSDGSPVSAFATGTSPNGAFYPGQPDDFNGIEECVHMGFRYRPNTNDFPCHNKLSFICKAQARVTIDPVSLRLSAGERKNVTVRLQKPIACTEPARGTDCPAGTNGCSRRCEVAVLFRNLFPNDLELSTCGLVFQSRVNPNNQNSQRIISGLTGTVEVRALNSLVAGPQKDYSIITLPIERSRDPFYQPVSATTHNPPGFDPSDILINRAPPSVPRICAATGDPHYTSFDGARFNFYGTGTLVFVKSAVWDLEVQTKLTRCWGSRSCNCAVAAREGPNFFELDVCGGAAVTPRVVTAFPATASNATLDAFKLHVYVKGNSFTATFPSGASIRASVFRGEYLNVYASVPGQVFAPFGLEIPGLGTAPPLQTTSNGNVARSGGLCGDFDGLPNNDLLSQQKAEANFVDANTTLFGFTFPASFAAPSIDDVVQGQASAEADALAANTFNCPRRSQTQVPPGTEVTTTLEENTGEVPPAAPSPPNSANVPQTTFTQAEMDQAEAACRMALAAAGFPGNCATTDANGNPIDFNGAVDACTEDFLASKGDQDLIDQAIEAIRALCNAAVQTAGTGSLTCPSNCNGNGQCDTQTGLCACFTSFTGASCKTSLLARPVVTGSNRATCDQRTNGCTSVILTGEDFAESAMLTCHFTFTTDDPGTAVDERTLAPAATPGTHLSDMSISCALPVVAARVSAQAFAVRASNTPAGLQSTGAANLTVFDSACSTCSAAGVCAINGPGTFCEIDGLCRAKGEVSAQNDCFACQPLLNSANGNPNPVQGQTLAFTRLFLARCGPQFPAAKVTADGVQENADLGAYSTTVLEGTVATAKDLTGAAIPFHFFLAAPGSAKFRIDAATGRIFGLSGASLDAEAGNFVLDVTVTDNLVGNLLDTVQVEIPVADVNDAATAALVPEAGFDSGAAGINAVAVPEDTAANTVVATIVITDPDFNPNSPNAKAPEIVNVALVDGLGGGASSGPDFFVTGTAAANGNLPLLVNSDGNGGTFLDFETRTAVFVQVTFRDFSQDANNRPAFYSTTFEVAITNGNDAVAFDGFLPVGAPAGQFAAPAVTVAENLAAAQLGTLVFSDEDANAVVAVAFASAGNPDGAFALGPVQCSASGTSPIVCSVAVLTSSTPANFEARADRTRAVSVVATDDGGAMAAATLTVTLSDANDAPTGLAFDNADAAATSIAVPEDRTAGIPLFVFDEDMPGGAPQGQAIAVVSAVPDVVEVTGTSGNFELSLKAGAAFDFETAPTVTVTLTVTDQPLVSFPGGATFTQTLTVSVTDVNEAPVFPAAAVAQTVNEGTAEGTVVLTLAATDVDSTNVRYYLFEEDLNNNPLRRTNRYFALDDRTGDLSVNELFSLNDFSARARFFSFDVIAFDNTDTAGDGLGSLAEARAALANDPASDSLFSRTRVTITVADANFPPVFREGNQIRDQVAVTVSENLAENTVFGDFAFDNADMDTLAYKVTDSLTGGSASFSCADFDAISAPSVLKLDDGATPIEGRLLVNQPALLDFETAPTFSVFVLVRETNTPEQLCGALQIDVTLTNANDAPTITLSTNTFQAGTTSQLGAVVALAPFADQDALRRRRAVSSTVTVSLAVGNAAFSGLLAYNAATQQVEVAGPLTGLAGQETTFTLTASDGIGEGKAEGTLRVFFGCNPTDQAGQCVAGFACDPNPAGCPACNPFHSGFLCNVPVDNCVNNDCNAANGICVSIPNSVDFSCICTGAGPFDAKCNPTGPSVLTCNPTCLNGGQCQEETVRGQTSTLCVCPTGFSGIDCSAGSGSATLVTGTFGSGSARRARRALSAQAAADLAESFRRGIAALLEIPDELVSVVHEGGDRFGFAVRIQDHIKSAADVAEAIKAVFASGAISDVVTRLGGKAYVLELIDEPVAVETQVEQADNAAGSGSGSGASGLTTIIGVVAGVALVLVLAIAAYVVVTRRRSSQQQIAGGKRSSAAGFAPNNGFNDLYDSMATPRASVSGAAAPAKLEYVFKAMGRGEAERRLAGAPNGTFLVREKPTSFALSLACGGKISHHLVECHHSSCTIDGEAVSASVNSVPALVKHLASNPEGLRTTLVVPPATAAAPTPWLVETFNRTQAEEHLRAHGRAHGSFVVRQKDVSCYVVSVVSAVKGGVEHHMCRRTADGFLVNGEAVRPACTTVASLVDRLRRDVGKGMSTVLNRPVTELAAAAQEAAELDDGDGYLRINPDAEDVYLAFDDDYNNEGDIYLTTDDLEAGQFAAAGDYLNRFTWYHPAMSMMEAESFLTKQAEGTFVVYGSPDQILAVKLDDRVRHDRLISTAAGDLQLSAASGQPWFTSLNALLAHYQSPRVGIPYELALYNIPHGVDQDIYLSVADVTGGDVYMDVNELEEGHRDVYMDVDDLETEAPFMS